MKRCPLCDVAYGEDDVFCEIDGARLDAPTLPVSPAAASAPSFADELRELAREVPTIAPMSSCSSCHMPNSDDGDGYCSACGHRLNMRATVSIMPPGAALGGCVVIAMRAADDVSATSKDGAEVAIAIGDSAILADEAAAAGALAGHPAAPRLLQIGEDPRRGPFLVLAPPPAGAVGIAEAAPLLDVAGALALTREVLTVALALEKAGFRWTPRQTDFYVVGGHLVLSRARAARLDGGRADACCPVAIYGRALFPAPGLTGSPALFRLLAGPGLDAPHAARNVDAMRAELDAVEAAMRSPRVGPPHVAVVCDGGLKRDHNEDAVAFASGDTKGEPWTVLVVCDGVSCSTHAEQASAVASKTACDALAHFARSGDIAHEAATLAMHAAIRAAHLAVCAAQIEHGDSEPPGTTIVAGLVYRRRLTVGWVGDSRAYWIGKTGSELLTRDHSWAQEAVARGDLSEEEAMLQPLAHALTRCLGPLEGGDSEEAYGSVQPDVRARDLPGPGHVVLCSDGLWNYFPEARTIAELVETAGEAATCELIAQRLVNHALYRGGGDNVSVAVYRHAETR